MNRLISLNTTRSSFKFFGKGMRSYSTSSSTQQTGRGFNKVLIFGGIIGLGLTTATVTYYNNTSVQRVVEGLQRLGTSMWTGTLVTFDYKYNLMGVEPDSPEEAEIYKTIHTRAANRVLDLCRKNGGLYIKGGQYLASLNHILPKEYTDTLSELQDSAPHYPFTMVERVFEQDFNIPIKEKFREFDEIPIAAASLAQVHRAVTLNGEEVAVKVQYEPLRGQFKGDMLTHRLIFYLLSKLFPGYDFTFAEGEMEEILATELDFCNEASNAERARKNLSVENVYIPKIFYDLSSERVLTCEFIHGCKINDKKRIEELGLDLKKVSYSMLKAFSEQIYIHGFFHADPHPGNVLVREHPDKKGIHQVVLLDHGLYKDMSNDLRLTWCKLWKAMIEKDEKTISDCTVELELDPTCSDTLVNMILMRSHNDSTRVGLGSGMTEEEIKMLQENAKHKMGEFVEILKIVPPAIWLVLRNNNLLRSVNQDLGVPVNRFLIMAREAVKGMNTNLDEEKASSWSDSVSSTYHSLKFETRLAAFLFSYWMMDLFISFLIKIGKVKEVELEELIDAA